MGDLRDVNHIERFIDGCGNDTVVLHSIREKIIRAFIDDIGKEIYYQYGRNGYGEFLMFPPVDYLQRSHYAD